MAEVRIDCPDCGKDLATTSEEEGEFIYSIGTNHVTLKCKHTVYMCIYCRYMWSGIEGELARANAVTEHLQKEVSRLNGIIDFQKGIINRHQHQIERVKQMLS